MDITLYAYQIVPGHDDTLRFAQSFAECCIVAKAMREDIRDRDPQGYPSLEPVAIYECVVNNSDVEVLVELLNDPTDIVKRVLVSKTLVTVVVD